MKLPAIQFYTGDWRKDPGVQSLSFHDRGVWFEILCLMNESGTRGKLLLNGRAMPVESLARLLGISLKEATHAVGRLIDTGVASRCEETGALTNRRMVRDEELRNKKRENGRKGGNPALVNQQDNHHVNQQDKLKRGSSSSTSISTSVPEVQTNNSEVRFPSLAEIQTEADMRGFDKAEAERFWNHFESSGWIDKNGNPIKNWRAKLAIWCSDAKARSVEKAHHGPPKQSPTDSSGAPTPTQVVLHSKELERVESRINTIRGTYSGMQSWSLEDKLEVKKLKARRDELKQMLGVRI